MMAAARAVAVAVAVVAVVAVTPPVGSAVARDVELVVVPSSAAAVDSVRKTSVGRDIS